MDLEAETKRALSRAYRLLAIRARSGQEMRVALRRAGTDETVVEEAIARLERQNLLNDRAFAAEWVRSRMQSRPRSRRLLERELRTKGVPGEDAADAASDVDDEATALTLATHRAGLMKGLDRQTFIRRLSNYLLNRGFSHATVSHVVSSVLSNRGDS